ncbi:hypothetical protein ES703_73086 [subsurface metagenome]
MVSFLGEFGKNYLRFRMQRVIADILARCLDQFTPEGLDLAIKDGWSAVDFLSNLSVTELKDLFMSLPSLKSATATNPSALQESLSRITPQDTIAEIVKRLPQYGEVLRANPQWLAKELSKAKAFVS